MVLDLLLDEGIPVSLRLIRDMPANRDPAIVLQLFTET